MKKIFFTFSIVPLLLIYFGWTNPSTTAPSFSKYDTVDYVLNKLGESSPNQLDKSIRGASEQIGKDLVLSGFASPLYGKKLPKQSKHFVCTSCHNIEREDPDLSISDPQARLEYTNQKGIPFLQGTTLYGAVNRTQFYNGDYDKKYGDLVKPARNNIREAIQLCAVECAQGRALEDWEVESILEYLWTIGLKMEDLNLTEEELQSIDVAVKNGANKSAMIQLIQSKYLQASPATFIIPPDDRKAGYTVEKGDPYNGELIYENSCLHCHEGGRYSFFSLDNSNFTFEHLEKHIGRYTRYSLYQVGRYGTPPMNGKRAYMPQYTSEKMSNQQMEDLRAYIEQEAR